MVCVRAMVTMPPPESALWQRYEGRIRAYGLRHLRESAAAQDLVQHVLLTVIQALRAQRVDDLSRLDAYVLGTCRYAVMDMRRGTARRQRLAEESASFTGSDESRPSKTRWRTGSAANRPG